MKEIAGVGELLPQVVVERTAEVAGMGEMHQTLGLAVEEVIVPGDRHGLDVVPQVLKPFLSEVNC